MAPLLSAGLTALFNAGPTLIRMIGQSSGDRAEVVANEIATVVEAVQGKPTPKDAARLQSVVDSLDPEQVAKIQLGLERIEAEREKNRLDHDVSMHTQQQETIRQSKDVKGVRPEIANRHSWFTMLYLFYFEAMSLIDYGPGANWEIAILIASPTLAWFGFRTWDKFSKQGAS